MGVTYRMDSRGTNHPPSGIHYFRLPPYLHIVTNWFTDMHSPNFNTGTVTRTKVFLWGGKFKVCTKCALRESKRGWDSASILALHSFPFPAPPRSDSNDWCVKKKEKCATCSAPFSLTNQQMSGTDYPHIYRHQYEDNACIFVYHMEAS